MISYYDIMSFGRGKAAATSNDFCMGNIRLLETYILETFIKITEKPYHENHIEILYRSDVLMSQIDMKSLEL